MPLFRLDMTTLLMCLQVNSSAQQVIQTFIRPFFFRSGTAIVKGQTLEACKGTNRCLRMHLLCDVVPSVLTQDIFQLELIV